MLPLLTAGAATPMGAMVPIASWTGTGSSAGTSFTNIPQTFQDLMLVFSATSTVNNTSPFSLAYTTNGGQTNLYGNGSSASSWRATNTNYIYLSQIQPNGNMSSTAPISGVLHILNYANTSTYKTFLTRAANDANGSGGTIISVASSATTAGITSLSFTTNNGSNYFTTGSTFSLYGIRSVGQ